VAHTDRDREMLTFLCLDTVLFTTESLVRRFRRRLYGLRTIDDDVVVLQPLLIPTLVIELILVSWRRWILH
jgi:hypothetical protein